MGRRRKAAHNSLIITYLDNPYTIDHNSVIPLPRPAPRFPTIGTPIALDVFLGAMGATDEMLNLGNFGILYVSDRDDFPQEAPNTAQIPRPFLAERLPYHGLKFMHPNAAQVPCIGVRTRSFGTSAKNKLPTAYVEAGIPFCCHTCGCELEDLFVGDHQPPTFIMESPPKAQRVFPFVNIQLVETEYVRPGIRCTLQTLYPFATDGLADLFAVHSPAHPYSAFNGQFLYPQCTGCSNHQMHHA